MTVHLHIERVVLTDVALDALGKRGLEAALREQLAGALAQEWLARQPGAHIARVAAGPLALGAQPDGKALGKAIGEAVTRTLGQP